MRRKSNLEKSSNMVTAFTDIPLFRNMTTQDIESVLQCVGAFLKEYKKEEFILLEEDKVQCVGCVVKGGVQMIREDIWGNKTTLINIGDRELFGETFACGSDKMASVSFVAMDETTVLFLPFDRVMHSCSSACAHHQKLVVNMVTVMAEKNARFISKIDILSKKTLREKIATYLLNEADYHNATYFSVPMGRVQLAEYLNADRSALTRELNLMKEEGILDFDKNTFRILKKFE